MFKNAENQGLLPAVNFHLWQPCNMRCKFCFATFLDVKQTCLPKGHLLEADAVKVVEELCKSGIRKITFAGGEPTLCPWLPRLLEIAKQYGVTTMVVTNGTRLEGGLLSMHSTLIDWVALSIDSLNPVVNEWSGRKEPGKQAPDLQWYLERVKSILDAGIRLKINTVVHRLNVDENLAPFISTVKPERWKLFQVLSIKGQNDAVVEDLLIGDVEFAAYIDRHQQQLPHQIIVPETNDDMTGSYLMVDPAGRFYDNVDGAYTYSRPILEVAIENALKDIRFDREKFVIRGGDYDWTN